MFCLGVGVRIRKWRLEGFGVYVLASEGRGKWDEGGVGLNAYFIGVLSFIMNSSLFRVSYESSNPRFLVNKSTLSHSSVSL